MADFPEADPRFSEFVILQAQNAGLFLGQIPHPSSGAKSVNLRAAGSVLDSLEMLASKTRGNLTASEEKLLECIWAGHAELQKVIQYLRELDESVPLQFENYR